MSAEIKTKYIFPPIPIRDFDWEASREGWDLGDLIGYGRTKEAAIQDLLEREKEEQEDETEELNQLNKNG